MATKRTGQAADDRGNSFKIHASKSPVGLTQLRAGFAVNAEYDRAFALGFPYVVCLTSKGLAPEEQAARAASLRLDTFIDAGVARRALRLLLKQAFTWPPKGISLTPAGKKLVASDAPIPRGDIETSLKNLVSKPNSAFMAQLPLLIEAELGSDIAAEVVSQAIQCIGDGRLKRNDGELGVLISRLGFVLLRSIAKTNKQVRKDLGEWLETKAKLLPSQKLARLTSFEPQMSPLRSADWMLNGADGIERSAFRPGGKLDPSSLLFCADPALVAAAVKNSPNGNLVAPVEARHAYTGGEAALALLMQRIAKVPQKESAPFVATFGPIRHPLVVAWLKRLSKLPEAQACLALHG